MDKRVLIARWLGEATHPIPIYNEAAVSSARQMVREAGNGSSLSQETVETVALIASELTHNQLSHARQGYFAVKPIERHGVKGLEVIAADMGSGIEKPGLAIRDTPSPDGSTLGAGLGAVWRLADEVEVDSRIEEGVCIVARKFERRPAAAAYCEVAILGRPYPGEAISGDDAVVFQSETEVIAAVSDGLGHGPEARQASNCAVEALRRNRQKDMEQIVVALNSELAATRGCAMSIVRFNKDSRTIESAAMGDVSTHLYSLRDAHFFASTPLILGHGDLPRQRVRIEKETAAPGSILVMFTDGLKSRTSLKGQLDVLRKPVAAIAEHLLENDSRPDDDVMVLAARFVR